MDESEDEVNLHPPPRVFDRLAQTNRHYTWDESIRPFHSSYDHWYIFGVRYAALEANSPASPSIQPTGSSLPRLTRPRSRKSASVSEGSTRSVSRLDGSADRAFLPVVARVSAHALRLEREFYLFRKLVQCCDPQNEHNIIPVELLRLPASQEDRTSLTAAIYVAPGQNDFRTLVDFGPAFWNPNTPIPGVFTNPRWNATNKKNSVPIDLFIDFALGACQAVELLHSGLRTIHGELRGDAFHFNKETKSVKLLHQGSGVRSFESAMTSSGWSEMAREIGTSHRLQYVAPEQTGRMPAEPDSRTDIYSLGVLFFTLLTGTPAVASITPIEVLQAIIGRKIPAVSSVRPNVPDAISRVVSKMVMKRMDERYNSLAGVREDLRTIQKYLEEGDEEALQSFQLGAKDLSSFFVLPNVLFGQEWEQQTILKVVQRVAHQQMPKRHFYSTSSSVLPFPDSRSDDTDDGSDGGSHPASPNSTGSQSIVRSAFLGENSSAHVDSQKTSKTDSLIGTSKASNFGDSFGGAPNKYSRRRPSQKIKRIERTNVIAIVGSAGTGKSTLVQSVQGLVRKNGYFASAKFDPAQKIPFDPLLKIMRGLFQQIFSEANINTSYHRNIRACVMNFWPGLSQMLNLPQNLITFNQSYDKPSQTEGPEGSSMAISDPSNNSQYSGGVPRAAPGSKTLRITTTFMEVLGVLLTDKLVCLSLDDLHFADDESIALLISIISAKLPLVIILTCRKDEDHLQMLRLVTDSGEANVTNLMLSPLNEQQVIEYIALALHRDEDYVLPLAAVALEKTGGNPFFLRQMLELCHRKNAIFFQYQLSQWEYDLDGVFREFESTEYGMRLNSDFIVRSMQDQLTVPGRLILAWASLLGNTWSFSLIRRILSGEFSFETNSNDSETSKHQSVDIFTEYSNESIVEGLQACLYASIITQDNYDDGIFRFAHERYQVAAQALRQDQDVEKMHFIIASALLKYSSTADKVLFALPRHVCLSVNVINERIVHRRRWREVLIEASEEATLGGARPTALYFMEKCMEMLQPGHWAEGSDVYYSETLEIYQKIADLHWYQGNFDKVLQILRSTFSQARTPADRARSWILQSRIFTKTGDTHGAFNALKTSLAELGLNLAQGTSWEKCDIEYEAMKKTLDSFSIDSLVERPLSRNLNIIAIGGVAVECMSAAYWSRTLLFYELGIKMLDCQIHEGAFKEIGLGLCHMSMMASGRHHDHRFAKKLLDTGLRLVNRFDDQYIRGRAFTIAGMFSGSFFSSIPTQIAQLEDAIHTTRISGDSILSLLALGGTILNKFYLGVDMAELEKFEAEDFVDWNKDLRGGLFLTAVKQVARSLQGKTGYQNPKTIITDKFHKSGAYLDWVREKVSNPEKVVDIYLSMSIVPLFLFGHHGEAVVLGRKLQESINQLLTLRQIPLVLFYLSISLIAKLREDLFNNESQEVIAEVEKYQLELDTWNTPFYESCQMWSLLLSAGLYELKEQHEKCISLYEGAIDHCQLHGFALDEAISYELQAEYFMRRGAKRAARSTLLDAIAAYSQVGATGKTHHLKSKHGWLLSMPSVKNKVDVAIQTDASEPDAGFSYEMQAASSQHPLETAGDRTEAWLKREGHIDASRLGLDILDLQSILQFNSIISSELQVDRLLAKMTEVILETSGATFAGVVIKDEGDGIPPTWSFAAVGTPEGGVDSQIVPLEAYSADLTANQVIHYTIRFQDAVYLQDVTKDERFFANATVAKSIIALPIFRGDVVLGVLYLEGQVNGLTSRNLGVLQLLRDQLGISIANALLFGEKQRISATNKAMIASQKKALAAARVAEEKARVAEAEALHNVKLRDEAAKAKSLFLANVSHELRTPLNGVLGMSELLKLSTLNAEQEGYADSIRVCADTLLVTINDLLDYSKLEAGKLKLLSIPLRLKSTIMEIVQALKYTNTKAELETIVELELKDDLMVLGDPQRIHQIFLNLVSNSYKFSYDKGSVVVRARAERENEKGIRVVCSVTDSGIGISEEQLSRLFTPFEQADTSTQRSYGGSGLGLSICKALLQILGGRIWIESQPGSGTTVFFSVDFQKAATDSVVLKTPVAAREPGSMDDAAKAPIVERPVIDLSAIPRDQLRVAIAEDNPINQKIAMSFVGKLGFKSEAFNDGRLAVEALRTQSKLGNPYHLVLMDCQMPVMDGYEATRLIRADADPAVSQVLVIAMTASAIRGDRERCLTAGMNDYLAKPVRAAVLEEKLEEYLQPKPNAINNLQASAQEEARQVIEKALLVGKTDGSIKAGTAGTKPRKKSV